MLNVIFSNTAHLEWSLGWTGLLVDPNAVSFSDFLTERRRQCQVVNACLSHSNYPEEEEGANHHQPEISNPMPNETNNSSHSSFGHVQCFPLYSLILAMGNPKIDYLSLNLVRGRRRKFCPSQKLSSALYCFRTLLFWISSLLFPFPEWTSLSCLWTLETFWIVRSRPLWSISWEETGTRSTKRSKKR